MSDFDICAPTPGWPAPTSPLMQTRSGLLCLRYEHSALSAQFKGKLMFYLRRFSVRLEPAAIKKTKKLLLLCPFRCPKFETWTLLMMPARFWKRRWRKSRMITFPRMRGGTRKSEGRLHSLCEDFSWHFIFRFVTKLLEDLVFFVCVVPNNGQDVLSVATSSPNRERQKLMREQNILAQVEIEEEFSSSAVVYRYFSGLMWSVLFLFSRYLAFWRLRLQITVKAPCSSWSSWEIRDTLTSSTSWNSATECWDIPNRTIGKIRYEILHILHSSKSVKKFGFLINILKKNSV